MIGILGLWAFPFTVHQLTKEFPPHLFPDELQGIVYLLVLSFAFGFIGGGIQTILQANNSSVDDFWDSILRP